MILAIFSQLTNSAMNHFSAQSYPDNLLFSKSWISSRSYSHYWVYWHIKNKVSVWHLVETACPWDQSEKNSFFLQHFQTTLHVKKKIKKKEEEAENSLLQGSCNYTSFPLKLVRRRRHRWKKVPRGDLSLVSAEPRPNIWVCIKRRNWM